MHYLIYAAGAAILIGFSQFEFLFKVNIKDGDELFVGFYQFIKNIADIIGERVV